MYKHILIATAGSELANKGLLHGLALAKTIKAAVTIVTVTEIWSSLAMAREVGAATGARHVIDDYEKHAAEGARTVLNAAVTLAQVQHGVVAEPLHIADQHPAEGIVTAAKDKNCDLIVMSSHGRRGLSRLLLGSQASEVLAHSSIPVLVVR
jgi:nucleotide-binding universal stress UspA family protein